MSDKRRIAINRAQMWLCPDGYSSPRVRPWMVGVNFSELLELLAEYGEKCERVHLYARKVRGFDHSTACAIWGEDGLGNLDGEQTTAPCSCGCLENWERHLKESAEKQLDAVDAELLWKGTGEGRVSSIRKLKALL